MSEDCNSPGDVMYNREKSPCSEQGRSWVRRSFLKGSVEVDLWRQCTGELLRGGLTVTSETHLCGHDGSNLC